MIALVPSRIAFATSEASARVGSGAWIIDSSICVAVITGLPRSRERRMIRFCRSGTATAPDLDPEVAARDHHRVRLAQDVVQHGNGLRLLDLRDHVRGRSGRLDQRLQRLHVRGRAHERERDEVAAELERELEIVDVLPRQRRDRERDAGQVDALVRDDRAADEHLAAGSAPLDVEHSEPDRTVVDEDVEPRLEDGAEHRRRDRKVAVSGAVLAGDRHGAAAHELAPARSGRRRGASAPGGLRSARPGGRSRPGRREWLSRARRDPRACRARS